MTIARVLLPGVVALAVAGPVSAQYGPAPPRYDNLVPSVRPASAQEPPPVARPFAQPQPLPVTMPPRGTSSAPMAESLGEMGTPLPTQAGAPYAALTGAPVGSYSLPQGSYPSPYYTDGAGSADPLSRAGRIGYEVYSYTGVSIPGGPGLAARLTAGWNVGGGIRTLYFDQSHTAAWTIDLGINFIYNGADQRAQNLFLRQPPTQDALGNLVQQPDVLTSTRVRSVRRTSFNYNFGRDVWLMGAGDTAHANGTNVRVGGWFGGRWGTASVDQIPLNEVDGYSRRQNVFHGIAVGAHTTWDMPMGGWVLFGGTRVEYHHDWTNLTPPMQGNIHNVDIQFTLGIRY
jgi:hypothetical protein